MSTDKKSFFVDAKRVIGMQCNGQSKKEKMINSGLKKTIVYKICDMYFVYIVYNVHDLSVTLTPRLSLFIKFKTWKRHNE
jgi:hypothetical protein